ncbi:MAG: hypothetical protein HZA22_11280 [Nitrospirae bacterium]|nr:hypothetical protein [Nitrospirota bacterium]
MARHLLMVTLLLLLVFPGNAFPDTSGASGDDAGKMMTQEEELYALSDYSGSDVEMVSGSTGETAGMTYPPAQHFLLRDDVTFGLGARFTGLTSGADSMRAAEYDYLHDSVAGGLSLHYYPLPWMLDLDFGIENSKDYDADLGVKFRDMIMLDYRSMGMYHNMDHNLFLNTQAPGDLEPDALYGVTIRDNDLTLTLKSPGRPYHVYVNLRQFDKDGTVQQRFDSNSFGNNKESVSRDIDWRTQELTAGVNGNVMGLFELDYHHTVKRFDNQADRLMAHTIVPPGLILRDHNSIPDVITHENVISVHSNQAWPLSGAATVAWGSKDNEYSGTRADFDRYYGDVTYRISDSIFAAVKYGRQNLNVTNLDTVLVTANMTVAPGTAVLRDSMSTKRDRGEVSLNYYPAANLLLLAQYKLDSVDRRNYKGWNDTALDDIILSAARGSSINHTGRLSATLTPMKHTKLRASFTATYNGDPSFVTDFQNSYEGRVWGTWTPSPGLVLNADAKIFRGDNPALSVPSATLAELDLNRDVEKDTAGLGVTWYAVPGLTLGTHYDYMRFKARQTIVVATTNIKEVPYWDTSHGYTVFGAYCFQNIPLSLAADFTQAWTRGTFFAETAAPDILASLSDQKIRDTRLNVKADYEVYRGWGTTLAYGVSQFRDMWSYELAERNSTAHYGSVMLTKKFK